jgi:hypothetical protein
MEGSLPFLPFCHADEIIGPSNIEFCEALCPGQVHEGILHEGKWVAIFDSSFMNSVVIDNQS